MILLLVLKNKIKDQISLIKIIKFFIEGGIIDIELKLIGTGRKMDFCKQYAKGHSLASINSPYFCNND